MELKGRNGAEHNFYKIIALLNLNCDQKECSEGSEDEGIESSICRVLEEVWKLNLKRKLEIDFHSLLR